MDEIEKRKGYFWQLVGKCNQEGHFAAMQLVGAQLILPGSIWDVHLIRLAM